MMMMMMRLVGGRVWPLPMLEGWGFFFSFERLAKMPVLGIVR